MTRRDLDVAVSWAKEEGWNPGLHDADAFFQTDPSGFFMGFLGKEPVACLTAVSYGRDFGFLGFYIVKKEFRGKTFGIQIWQSAMEYLSTQNVGLDGVVAQQENYKKSGFQMAYRNIRYEYTNDSVGGKKFPDIVKLSEIPFSEILKYDNELFPVSRLQFLKNWIKLPESLALGAVDNKNKLTGYGVIRKCVTGYKIGPLFANDTKIAEKLFRVLTAFVNAGEKIYLDIPEVNPEALKFVKKHKMKYVFETARMYTKNSPKLNFNKIFGITTFELG